MEWFMNLIFSTHEYQGWGWNIVSISFLVTAGFTFFLQLPGLVNQARTIWRNKSAEGVEMLTFTAFLTYFAVFFVYAVSIQSGAGVLNVLVLLVPQVFILAGIAWCKPLRTIDKLAALAATLLFVLAVLLPRKEVFYTIASIAVLIGLLLQPIEMMRTKVSKNIALSFPLNFLIVAAVWTIYALAIGDVFLAGASGAFTLVYLWAVILWFRYRQ